MWWRPAVVVLLRYSPVSRLTKHHGGLQSVGKWCVGEPLTSIKERLLADRKALLDLGTRNRLVHIPLKTKNIRAIEIVDEKTSEVFRLLGESKRFAFSPTNSDVSDGDTELSPGALAQPTGEEPSSRQQDKRLKTRLSS